MSIAGHVRGATLVLLLGLILVGCASLRPKVETTRGRDVPPSPPVVQAVQTYKASDPDASFTFFNGHVDSFATTAKSAVPDYARPILESLGLSTTPRMPLKLPAPVSQAQIAKPARDLDADFDVALPMLPEKQQIEPSRSQGAPDAADLYDGKRPADETRRRPAADPQRLVTWERPSADVVARERRAAQPILQAFLERNRSVFEIAGGEAGTVLRQSSYQAGAYFRKAVFEQYYAGTERLLYGRTVVHFDVNWNVIGVSRMITTPGKLPVAAMPARALDRRGAYQVAARRFAQCGGFGAETVRAERVVDPVRRLRVWDIELRSLDGDCHYRVIVDGAGRILNVSDLVDRQFNDAKVNRWYFPGGDQFSPQQTVSTGMYTRNDRRLEHDFFYLMNDHRCDGAAETTCTQTPHSSMWCERAHGTYDGESSIRATRRPNRDFDQFYPGAASETFAETNTYYWGRFFAQWLKPSLDAMGVLPDSASDYPRVLIVTDACRSGSAHNSSYQVTTEDNKGEGTNVIRLAHRNPGGSSNHNAACEGGGCFDNPSNLQHEMNHFFLKRYYGVDSDLDCGASNQLKFTHEGILGTAVPQAYWHHYYGVGYAPSSTNKLYFSHSATGRVHTNDSNRMTIGNFLCVDNTDEPYRAGRVVGQALWEIYHGRKVSGDTIGSTWYPSTDTDFNIIVYWAADLQAGSTYKDRYEFANRLMEILDKHSNWSSSGKQDYCEIFEHHELRAFINADYCN